MRKRQLLINEKNFLGKVETDLRKIERISRNNFEKEYCFIIKNEEKGSIILYSKNKYLNSNY